MAFFTAARSPFRGARAASATLSSSIERSDFEQRPRAAVVGAQDQTREASRSALRSVLAQTVVGGDAREVVGSTAAGGRRRQRIGQRELRLAAIGDENLVVRIAEIQFAVEQRARTARPCGWRSSDDGGDRRRLVGKIVGREAGDARSRKPRRRGTCRRRRPMQQNAGRGDRRPAATAIATKEGSRDCSRDLEADFSLRLFQTVRSIRN